MAARPLLLSLALLLAGCATRVAPVAVVRTVAPVAPTPINAGLSPAATLWHLRAGLNVAALACRGPDEAALVTRYNALLAGHAATLAAAEAAYAAEYRAAGGAWRDRYDDAMTRLYNFFAQERGRAGFCRSAAAVLGEVEILPDAALASGAADRLALLDHPFAPPRLEVDARVFTGPTRVMMAAR